MQRMVIKQIRNAVQQELTYIQDQCPLLGPVHRLVLGHCMEIFKLNCKNNKIVWSVWALTNEGIVF